jgi:hypothetical protein
LAAAKAAPVVLSEEDKLKAILKAVLSEPILEKVSTEPLVKRIAQCTRLGEEEVWRITGLKKSEPPPHYLWD